MQPEATIETGRSGPEYLTSIQSLSEELAYATAAIARDDIEGLEKHIDAQQSLCAQLHTLLKSAKKPPASQAARTSLNRALLSLARNNQVYSKLLVASGRSHGALLTLCKAYNDNSSHAAEQVSIARSLSCEV